MSTNKKWTDESVAKLLAVVGSTRPVSTELVDEAATALEISARSVAAKLRHLDIEVASMAKEKASAFSPEDTASLTAFLNQNPGAFTYKEISERFGGGAFSPKVIQGKILSLELTGLVKPTPKVEVAKTYTEAEETTMLSMVKAGAFVEEIATKLNKSINQIRGKALSMLRAGAITSVPKMRESHAAVKTDVLDGLNVASMTVAEIVAATNKTERGIKTMLTKRGLDAKDYKGSDKKAKAEKARAEA